MEAEDVEPATRSQVPVMDAPIRPFATKDDETMEQEGPESKRQRSVAGLPLCSLLPPVDGFESLEDAKHLAAIIRNRSKIGAIPQSSLGSKGSREK